MLNKCVTVSFLLLIPLRYDRKITSKITEKLHSIFDMQRRKVTKVTKITSKLHTNKKNNILSRIVMKLQIVTYVFHNICNYCNYSITDSDFCCNFSCNSYVTHVTIAATEPGVV